jgi:DNA-binding NtrC family response regulator
MVLDERTEEFEALSRSLEAAGVRSIRVSTFEEGIRGLASGSIDVVVASTTIRDGGAVRIYEDVKACRPLAQVIFLTGPGRAIGDGSDQSNGAGHRVTDVIASLEAGATDFFVLPLRDIHCLQESIQSALKRVDRWRVSLVGPLEEERTG